MTIRDIQENAKELAPKFKDKNPEQRMMYLMSEVGETAIEVLKLQGFRSGGDAEELKQKLGMEIFDVVWNLCDLANMYEIDLEKAFATKIAVNEERFSGR
jgi:NTP pyrophosphatase (non-canonical NTP hydrolase)